MNYLQRLTIDGDLPDPKELKRVAKFIKRAASFVDRERKKDGPRPDWKPFLIWHLKRLPSVAHYLLKVFLSRPGENELLFPRGHNLLYIKGDCSWRRGMDEPFGSETAEVLGLIVGFEGGLLNIARTYNLGR